MLLKNYLDDKEWDLSGFVDLILGQPGRVPQVMKDVFTDSNVIFVGMGIGVVSKKIEKGQELKIGRTVEVKDLAERVNG
ncbi:hypothetical protein IFM89_031745 [Coptis chinensis]|uniref:Uncharacterized protein n=1 Tax=Coptis chinensis TaxID=261450 RepID=A0A835LK06_9MAGN|nr:hypothetical protein IFM89_031745 [Coptis chinensis]